MNMTYLAAAAFLLASPAIAQSQSEHQQHLPSGSAPVAQAQSPATPSQAPSTSAQPQTSAPSGPMMGGMHGMMHGQAQGGPATMMSGQPGMTMSCPMMQAGMRGMMGAPGMRGAMGADAMMPMMGGRARMMKVMFAIADTNGDGGLSFDEVSALHKRIFDRVDANKDGKVTVEEAQAFMHE